MGRRGELNDRIDMLKTAVDGSPTGPVLVGVGRAWEGTSWTGFASCWAVWMVRLAGFACPRYCLLFCASPGSSGLCV